MLRFKPSGWQNLIAAGSLAALTLFVTACVPTGTNNTPSATTTITENTARAENVSAITPELSCSELSGMDLAAFGGQGSEVVSAKMSTHQSVPVCDIEGRLQPEITFRLLLPTETWTGRYLQLGCGGLCGAIDTRVLHADGCARLGDGEFAIAATDMGHSGRSAEFGNDPQKRIDFAYRAVHLTAQSSKAIVDRFYGRPADYAYYTGCSDGGRAGLAAAQRYPDDFDGIIAGAPVMNFQVQNTFDHTWRALSNTSDTGQPILKSDRLPVLHDAALAACDLTDGMADRIISDPRSCEFDPRTIVCESEDAEAGCLSKQEAEAAYKIYRGPRDADSGIAFSLGGPQPGSELSWEGVFVPAAGRDFLFSELIARDVLGNLAFEENPDPGFSLADFEYTLETFERIRPMHSLYGATNPDLSR
ncbi:MAG: tannase/feruloyl esterase family alpha/beta hydrolase, partial [Pseudomonadota bacterium]